ncbi:MAG: sulfotransferase family protein, partial [Planctomycetes bacterium]|nr:sulfotransferase family protein [Planctomycetota bacterium]
TFPRDQLLILKTADLEREPQAVLDRVTDFVGLPHFDFGEFTRFNPGKYAPLDDKLRARLDSYFAPHNQRLRDAFGIDFYS